MIEVSYGFIFIINSLLLLISSLTVYSFFYLKHKKTSFFIFLFCVLILINFLIKEKYNILPIKIVHSEDSIIEKNLNYLNLIEKK